MKYQKLKRVIATATDNGNTNRNSKMRTINSKKEKKTLLGITLQWIDYKKQAFKRKRFKKRERETNRFCFFLLSLSARVWVCVSVNERACSNSLWIIVYAIERRKWNKKDRIASYKNNELVVYADCITAEYNKITSVMRFVLDWFNLVRNIS